jgi:hypothetical protein
MPDVPYLYIFMTTGCDPAVHRAVLDTPEGAATTVGVSDLAQACEVARSAVGEGAASFIELCGAFEEEGARRVSDAVGGRVPVGYVTYLPGDAERVDALFG